MEELRKQARAARGEDPAAQKTFSTPTNVNMQDGMFTFDGLVLRRVGQAKTGAAATTGGTSSSTRFHVVPLELFDMGPDAPRIALDADENKTQRPVYEWATRDCSAIRVLVAQEKTEKKGQYRWVESPRPIVVTEGQCLHTSTFQGCEATKGDLPYAHARMCNVHASSFKGAAYLNVKDALDKARNTLPLVNYDAAARLIYYLPPDRQVLPPVLELRRLAEYLEDHPDPQKPDQKTEWRIPETVPLNVIVLDIPRLPVRGTDDTGLPMERMSDMFLPRTPDGKIDVKDPRIRDVARVSVTADVMGDVRCAKQTTIKDADPVPVPMLKMNVLVTQSRDLQSTAEEHYLIKSCVIYADHLVAAFGITLGQHFDAFFKNFPVPVVITGFYNIDKTLKDIQNLGPECDREGYEDGVIPDIYVKAADFRLAESLVKFGIPATRALAERMHNDLVEYRMRIADAIETTNALITANNGKMKLPGTNPHTITKKADSLSGGVICLHEADKLPYMPRGANARDPYRFYFVSATTRPADDWDATKVTPAEGDAIIEAACPPSPGANDGVDEARWLQRNSIQSNVAPRLPKYIAFAVRAEIADAYRDTTPLVEARRTQAANRKEVMDAIDADTLPIPRDQYELVQELINQRVGVVTTNGNKRARVAETDDNDAPPVKKARTASDSESPESADDDAHASADDMDTVPN